MPVRQALLHRLLGKSAKGTAKVQLVFPVEDAAPRSAAKNVDIGLQAYRTVAANKEKAASWIEGNAATVIAGHFLKRTG